MLEITINIIDFSNYITCTIIIIIIIIDYYYIIMTVLSFTNVERLFTTTNEQLLYLSPIAFYFCFLKSIFLSRKN